MKLLTPPLFMLLLGACPSEDTNPPRLWLALDGTETQVKLIDYEPPPF